LLKKTWIITTFLVLLLSGCTNIIYPQKTPLKNINTSIFFEIIKLNLSISNSINNTIKLEVDKNIKKILNKNYANNSNYYINDTFHIINKNKDIDNEKLALLTFDDAPSGNSTLKILDTLDKFNVKAIFFINGHLAQKYPDLIKEIDKRGHIIGNHTWWHENLSKLTYDETYKEIISVNQFIEQELNKKIVYFRPPFGMESEFSKEIIQANKMISINWSVGSLDWVYNNPKQADKVVEQIKNTMHRGGVILMHDKEVTAIALDEILKFLQEKEYKIVLPINSYNANE